MRKFRSSDGSHCLFHDALCMRQSIVTQRHVSHFWVVSTCSTVHNAMLGGSETEPEVPCGRGLDPCSMPLATWSCVWSGMHEQADCPMLAQPILRGWWATDLHRSRHPRLQSDPDKVAAVQEILNEDRRVCLKTVAAVAKVSVSKEGTDNTSIWSRSVPSLFWGF